VLSRILKKNRREGEGTRPNQVRGDNQSNQRIVRTDNGDGEAEGTANHYRRIIWECVGIVGVNPDPFSFRELVWMARGRMVHHWDLFAPLICCVINPWVGKDKQLTPNQIHPFRTKQTVKAFSKKNWSDLKQAIMGRGR
jgi:hypothetical protein